MSHFPFILIPRSIEQVRLAQPPSPPAPLEPNKPGAQPDKYYFTVLIIEAIAAVLFLSKVPVILLIALGAIAYQAWNQSKTYPQRLQEFRNTVAAHSKAMQDYERAKRDYEKEVAESRSPGKVAVFQYNLLLQVLQQTIPNDGDRSTATEGASEKLLSDRLSKYFPNKIHTGLTLSIPDFDYPYTPDMAYIDRNLNLYIDIEVDEPYAYKTGEPTHFLDYWKDSKRNNFFLNKGWLVIRFSEEQVVCLTDSCCKTVAGAIAQITGQTSIMRQFANIADLQPMKQWTEEEARQMAAANKRDRYPTVTRQPQNFNSPPRNTSRVQTPIVSNTVQQNSPSSNTSVSTVTSLSVVVACPYCCVRVRSSNLESHKRSRCPKRPL